MIKNTVQWADMFYKLDTSGDRWYKLDTSGCDNKKFQLGDRFREKNPIVPSLQANPYGTIIGVADSGYYLRFDAYPQGSYMYVETKDMHDLYECANMITDDDLKKIHQWATGAITNDHIAEAYFVSSVAVPKSACDHLGTMKEYNSGWTHERFCTACGHKEKL